MGRSSLNDACLNHFSSTCRLSATHADNSGDESGSALSWGSSDESDDPSPCCRPRGRVDLG